MGMGPQSNHPDMSYLCGVHDRRSSCMVTGTEQHGHLASWIHENFYLPSINIIIIPEIFPYDLPLGARAQLILELYGLTTPRPNPPPHLTPTSTPLIPPPPHTHTPPPTDTVLSNGRGEWRNIYSNETAWRGLIGMQTWGGGGQGSWPVAIAKHAFT